MKWIASQMIVPKAMEKTLSQKLWKMRSRGDMAYLFSNLAAAPAGSDARRCSHLSIRWGLPGLRSNEDRKARNCSPVTPRTNCPL